LFARVKKRFVAPAGSGERTLFSKRRANPLAEATARIRAVLLEKAPPGVVTALVSFVRCTNFSQSRLISAQSK